MAPNIATFTVATVSPASAGAVAVSTTLVKPDRADTPIPLGRQGTAWEVANSVIFLLCDQAAYITGQTLVIDGGLSGLC